MKWASLTIVVSISEQQKTDVCHTTLYKSTYEIDSQHLGQSQVHVQIPLIF